MSEWNRAERHAQRAQRFFRAGKWERALHELREALDHRPEEGEWLFGLGLTLDELERFDEAADAYARALEIRGEDVPGLLHLGIDLIRVGQPAEALESLQRVNELDPAFALGYVHRILANTMLEDHEQAEVMFYLAQQALDHLEQRVEASSLPDEPSLDDEDEDLADLALIDGLGDEALDEEEDDAELDPSPQTLARLKQIRAVSYDYLAQSLLLRDEDERALWCWQEALRLDPRHPEVNRRLAMLHRRRGQDQRARLHYQRQLRIAPDDAGSLMEYADLMLARHQAAKAAELYRRVLRLDPAAAIAHQRLGELALARSQHAAAADRLERARRLDPQLPGLHLSLARLARRSGDQPRVRDCLRRELEAEGQTAEQTLLLARMLVEHGLEHESIRLLNPLLSGADDLLIACDRHYAEALLCRGRAKLAEGDREGAIADYRRCLKLDPRRVSAMMPLIAAHVAADETAEAMVWIRRGLAVRPHHRGLRQLRRKLRVQHFRQRFRRWFGR